MRAGILVLMGGLLSVTADGLHWPQPRVANLRMLFGALLLASVAPALYRIWYSDADGTQYQLYTCQLVRNIYVLLYVMAAVRLCYSALGGSIASNVFQRIAADKSLTEFQIYIGYAFAVVCVVRLSGAGRHRPSHLVA